MLDTKNILAHRGYWAEKKQQNTYQSFKDALDRGFGIETDFRDYDGKIFVSHDCITQDQLSDLVSLEQFLELVAKYDNPKIACNVKSDGLLNIFKERFLNFEVNLKSFVFFDMSIPQQYLFSQSKFSTWSRLSEFENITNNPLRSQGYWIDGFQSDLAIMEHLENVRYTDLELVIVSSELHGRNPDDLWNFLRVAQLHQRENWYLCTDWPDRAIRYFGEYK